MGFTGLPVGSPGSTLQLGGAGLALIRSVSFSATAAVSLDGCFTANYANYRVMLSISAPSSDANLSTRLRAAGADSSAASYAYAVDGLTTSDVLSKWVASGQTAFVYGQLDLGNSGALYSYALDFLNPQAALATTVAVTGFSVTQSGLLTGHAGAMAFTAATQFDGFTVYPSAGNITGSLAVYGYRKA